MAMGDFIQSGMDDLDLEGGGFPDEDFLSGGLPEAEGEELGFSSGGFEDGEGMSDDDFPNFAGAEGAEIFDSPQTNVDGDPEEKGGTIKKALVGLAFLAVAGLVVVFAIRWFGSAGKDKPSDQGVVNTGVQGTEVTQPQSGTTPDVQAPAPQVAPSAQTNVGDTRNDSPTYLGGAGVRPQTSTVSDGWIWVESDPQLQFSNTIDGVFTVTNIKYVSKVVESQKTLQLKSILTGSIDGVYGTYEVDVPYDKAVGLTVGTRLYITYVIAEKNGVQYVSGIEF